MLFTQSFSLSFVHTYNWFSRAFQSPGVYPIKHTGQMNVTMRSEATSAITFDDPRSPTEFVILGSGVSTGIPRISCIIRPEESSCVVCQDAVRTPNSKNRRCNVSALVRSAGYTILIDCGKTIRESAMRHFPKLNVRNVDAIVLTHGHADAVLGLDDTRDIQVDPRPLYVNGTTRWSEPVPTPVFLNEETMATCRNVFPYLMPPDKSSKRDVKRRVSALDWRVYGEHEYFLPFRPIPRLAVEFTPIPMFHGGDYICMGYIISIRPFENGPEKIIAYLSDLNDLPMKSLQFIKDIPKIDLLVVDLLTESEFNIAHFSRQRAEQFVKDIRPVEAVAVGMTCSLGLHDEINKSLQQMLGDGLSFRLAYDGERFPCA